MQCKYYQILLGRTCEWSLWRVGRFIEVVFKTGSTVMLIMVTIIVNYVCGEDSISVILHSIKCNNKDNNNNNNKNNNHNNKQ